MSIIDAITQVASLGDKALSLIPDENAKRKLAADFQLAILNAEASATTEQAAIVEKHGQSSRFFVAGYRPAAAWVCVAALALQAVIETASWAIELAGYDRVPPPNPEWLWLILPPLLGIGGFRMVEKIRGVSREHMGPVVTDATKARWRSENATRDEKIRRAEEIVSRIEKEQGR